ncbi:MAG: hypothetical protein K2F82_06075, partial [Muribaculaceae bacterium]|nr:hypothetical protein [Muribaculaceae bacterium]
IISETVGVPFISQISPLMSNTSTLCLPTLVVFLSDDDMTADTIPVTKITPKRSSDSHMAAIDPRNVRKKRFIIFD